ncbi:hypothetical protein DEAC_c40250 [Desulfosporosinus acididurans]|uniref:Uncharacterized protein n=1 Tax=Desulfosporosinus acididurans TaxID=476652 RepID=A0A0J1IHA3_9FIRM|nr:hypothetical protein [Desulfosporosinus acididurans]KLU64031.1 hypothetical protein DEAC_c40250 [Desulfosporosinus acididurans]
MDILEMFKKLRDVSGEVVEALENGDEEKAKTAMGKFLLLMIQLDALK